MSRRYDPISKVLNLSQFHLDEGTIVVFPMIRPFL